MNKKITWIKKSIFNGVQDLWFIDESKDVEIIYDHRKGYGDPHYPYALFVADHFQANYHLLNLAKKDGLRISKENF